MQYGALLGGIKNYGYPLVTRLFWSSLTLLDPLAALLLFARPRSGLVLALAIIVSDVAHNSWITLRLGTPLNWQYWSQVAFLVFIVATIRFAWRGLLERNSHSDETPT
jgi:hypothetical protein